MNPIDTLKNGKIKDTIKEIIHTVADLLYNDMFFYICIICIYSISSFVILLAILYSCIFNYPRIIKYSMPTNNCENCAMRYHHL